MSAAALDQTLAALAEPSRRKVVDLLGRGPRRAGELAAELGASRPAMSRHLRVLRDAGLVEARASTEDARGREYHLRPAPLLELTDWASDVQAFWTDQLDGFAAHVEGTDAP